MDPAMIREKRRGCVWDLIRSFGLRRGFYSQKLVSGSEYLRDQEHLPSHHVEKDQGTYCASEDGKQVSKSIRMLMDEEISKVEKLVHIPFPEEKWHKNSSKQTVIPSDVTSDQPDSSKGVPNSQNYQSQQHEVLVERLQEILALMKKVTVEEHGVQMLQEKSMPSESVMGKKIDNTEARATQNHHILRRKLSEVIEKFLSNNLIGMREMKDADNSQQSQELLELVETLNSDTNLSQGIFQVSDLNISEHIQHLWNAHGKEQFNVERCKLLEYIKPLENESQSIDLCEKPLNQKTLQKKRNSRKGTDARREALEKLPTLQTESSSTASSSNCLPQSTSSLRAHMKDERAVFHISLREIKRRARKLLGHRNKQNFTRRGSQTKSWYGFHPKKYLRWMTRNMIGAHLLSMGSHNAIRSNSSPRIKAATEPSGNEAAGELDFEIKAKRHIIEMLDIGDDTIHLPGKKAKDTLEELLSLEEEKPISSHDSGRRTELVSPPTRPFGVGSVHQQTSIRECCLLRYAEEDFPCIASTSDYREESQGIRDQPTVTTGNRAQGPYTAEALSSEDARSEESDDSISKHEGGRLDQNSTQDLPKAKVDLQCPMCSTPGDLDVNQTESPHNNSEKRDQPSPVSVLDQLLLDEVASPEGIAPQENKQDEHLQLPRRLQLEEHCDSMSKSPRIAQQPHQEDERSNLSYLRALLEASGLLRREAWESHRRRRRRQLFDPSIFEEVEPPPNSNPVDLGLFLDRVEEALREMYERRFKSKPWVSFLDTKVQPFPEGEELLADVWRKVRPFEVSVNFRTVDEIIGRDMSTGVLAEIEEGVDEIGIAIGDEVLEEVLDEMLLEIPAE